MGIFCNRIPVKVISHVDVLITRRASYLLWRHNPMRCGKLKKKVRVSTLREEEKGKEIQMESEPSYKVNTFAKEEIDVNKNINVNIFRNENDRSSAYDEGMCIYNILQDIEIKYVKKIPVYNQKLANVKIEKGKNKIKLIQHRNNNDGGYLDDSLIYKDTRYDLPFILNYYPDDMFILCFDGVITLSKQEKIVIAFLTFLKIFKQSFKFNDIHILNFPLYEFIKSRTYLFGDCSDTDTSNLRNDPFILLKIIPKFIYTRLLYIYKYIKRNEDIVIMIKYIYDEIDAICRKYNYDINEMIHICNEKNVMAHRLQRLKGGTNMLNGEGNYEVVRDLTEGTFDPSILLKYKSIENFSNVFPSFRVDFENFYLNNTYLKLYKKYKVHSQDVANEFDKMRSLLMEREKEAYKNLVRYRYVCNSLSEKEKKNHETFNHTCIDIINYNINIFKKPIYVISSVEKGDFIMYTLNLFGLNIKHANDRHLLRIFGRDALSPTNNKRASGGTVFSSLSRYLQATWQRKGHAMKKDGQQTSSQDTPQDTPQKEEQADGRAAGQGDLLHDPYNLDVHYLQHLEKTKRKDYYLCRNPHYISILKDKCDLVDAIVKTYHQGKEMIHVVDQKYEDLNAMNNDSRFNKLVRLYFCEWGHNTYCDKFKAICNDKIKSFSKSFKLLFLCCTLQNSSRREHTHGKGIPLDVYSKFMLKYYLKHNMVEKKSAIDAHGESD
ncbi:conserved Plasmodium protein, unknown function [Plasmodium ovale wallikeri]|uniref:Uncharacterized protein n=1 Tax=Plasmodium ovale wallikeri TaxID=864142 RepID=A0A1A8YMI1_PLAOA|nr:conserved Plasmodium protein, unknown function [Plasmodium ovale wallikeri]